MSSLPQRQRGPPERLQNQQARNRAEEEARRKDRPKTVVRPKGKNIQPQPKRKLEAKNAQSRVLTILDALSKGKNPKVYNMLFSIYRDASSTLINRLELDDNELIRAIEEQYKVMKENIRQSGREDKNKLTLDFETPDDKIKKTDIRNHFNEWYQTNYQQRPPKATELYEQLEKNIGKQRNRAWYGYRIVYEAYDSEDEEENSD